VVAYSREGARLDAQGDEEPAACTRSASDGSFAFRVPRGDYDLYAVPPGEARAVRHEGLATRRGPWRVELPSPPPLQTFHAALRTSEGTALGRAHVEVRLLLEGGRGARHVTWRELTSDDQGALAFSRDPAIELELLLAHAAVGRRAMVLSAPEPHQDLSLPRASFLQVAEARAAATTASVLDAAGRVLAVRGPLHAAERVALRAGWSPVLEVPAQARWLELHGTDGAPLRVPIEPRPGAVLQIKP